MTPKDNATRLAALGYFVFPFSADGSKPRTRAWSRIATRSPAQIRAWCSETPCPPWRSAPVPPVTNFGLFLSAFRDQDHALLVLQAIGELGERSLARLTWRWGLPRSPRVISPDEQTTNSLFYSTARLCTRVRKMGPGLFARVGVDYVPAPGCATDRGAWFGPPDMTPTLAPDILIDLYRESPKAHARHA